MQRVRTVVKKFMLPIALMAGVGWALAFVYMFVALPQHSVGYATLLVVGGVVMSVPWIIMGLGVIQRIHQSNVEAKKDEPGDSPGNA